MSAGKRDSVTDKALRRAVDDCLLSADPSPESEELLRRYSASALRCILERRDRFLLAEALRREGGRSSLRDKGAPSRDAPSRDVPGRDVPGRDD